jgi:4-hydroxy-tetrahydrodipicolinate reductase
MTSIAIYGAGLLGTNVAKLLSVRPWLSVYGPYGRTEREKALRSGADVVIIATTTRLRDVADDVREAINFGSNVLISAEEAAFPFIVDDSIARSLDSLARQKGVSVAGTGVNPGLIFDALVLTILGSSPRGCRVHVRRVVDISGFGETVLRRIGVGKSESDFALAVESEEILGHAGFPQSIHVVANALGLKVERIEKILLPVLATQDIELPGKLTIKSGESAGVSQTYTGIVDGKPWFIAHFFGHVALNMIKKDSGDDIDLMLNQKPIQSIKLRPGIGAQVGSQNMVANSIDRIISARPGWVTVAEMSPAFPAPVA